MQSKNKVSDFFDIEDNFHKFYNAIIRKHTIKSQVKRKYHRESAM